MKSPLYSKFIIDGVQQDLVPARILGLEGEECGEVIVDESLEPGLGKLEFHSSEIDRYLSLVVEAEPFFPVGYAASHTKLLAAKALIEKLWQKDEFVFDDLRMDVRWSWNAGKIGNMAAFYSSVESLSEYMDTMYLPFGKVEYSEAEECGLSLSAGEGERALGDFLVADPTSWLVWIPFDPAEFRLGGSVLAHAARNEGSVAPQIGDADYFLDCFEVVRELVEDGILLSGATVAEGGMLAAVKKMTAGGVGASVDISSVMQAYGEDNIVRILFAEVPGVLVQIKDSDFDYLDAELLLQDVAFYPLGHPDVNSSDVRVKASRKSGIQKILESLVQNQSAEGED